MQPAELATHKLIILSIIQRIPGITLNQLTTTALETLYMDYFEFVTAYEELCRDRMISEAVRKREERTDAMGRPVTRCDLSPQGLAVLKTLEARIPMPIRSYLAQACSGWKKDMRLQSTLTADYELDANGAYAVHLKQNDGLKDLVDIKLNIPEKSMAQQVCERWKRSPQTVYLGLLSVLTGEPVLQPDRPPASESEALSDGEDHLDDALRDAKMTTEPQLNPRQQSLFSKKTPQKKKAD